MGATSSGTKPSSPTPPAMLARLKARGLKICVWINPYIAQRSPMFDEGMAGGYLLKRPDGDVCQWDRWQSGMGLVDFTNPEACRWYRRQAARLGRHGRRLLQDRLRRAHPDRRRLPRRLRPAQDAQLSTPISTTRPCSTCSRRSSARARPSSSPARPPPAASSSPSTGAATAPPPSSRWPSRCAAASRSRLSGFGFWSHDMGGFELDRPARRLQALVRLRPALLAQPPPRQPVLPRAVALRRRVGRRLATSPSSSAGSCPISYAAAARGPHTRHPRAARRCCWSSPTTRPATLSTGSTCSATRCSSRPCFSFDGVVDYYLPAGRWTHFLSGKVVEGGRWVREQYDFLSLPLFVRPNSAIVVGDNDQRPDYDYTEGFTLRVYQLDDGATAKAVIPAADGTPAVTFTVSRKGSEVTVEWQGEPKNWRVELMAEQRQPSGDACTRRQEPDRTPRLGDDVPGTFERPRHLLTVPMQKGHAARRALSTRRKQENRPTAHGCLMAACAAASRAIGTRYGLQLT